MSTDERLHSLDELRVTVSIVQKASGLPLDLSGVVVSDFIALVGKPGAVGVAGTVAILDAATGKVRVTFPEGALVVPSSLAQLRLSKAGETQTVWSEQFAVAAAVLAAP